MTVRVPGSAFRVPGSGFRVPGAGFCAARITTENTEHTEKNKTLCPLWFEFLCFSFISHLPDTPSHHECLCRCRPAADFCGLRADRARLPSACRRSVETIAACRRPAST